MDDICFIWQVRYHIYSIIVYLPHLKVCSRTWHHNTPAESEDHPTYWQFQWSQHWIPSNQHQIGVFHTQYDPHCSTTWCWDRPLFQSSLSSLVLSTGSRTQYNQWGGHTVFKININEAMLMAKDAWDTVQPQQSNTAGIMPVTIVPTHTQKWDNEDNVQCLVRHTWTLSKLRSNGEEDYGEEWAAIGHMVSANASEFRLHAGRVMQEEPHD